MSQMATSVPQVHPATIDAALQTAHVAALTQVGVPGHGATLQLTSLRIFAPAPTSNPDGSGSVGSGGGDGASRRNLPGLATSSGASSALLGSLGVCNASLTGAVFSAAAGDASSDAEASAATATAAAAAHDEAHFMYETVWAADTCEPMPLNPSELPVDVAGSSPSVDAAAVQCVHQRRRKRHQLQLQTASGVRSEAHIPAGQPAAAALVALQQLQQAAAINGDRVAKVRQPGQLFSMQRNGN